MTKRVEKAIEHFSTALQMDVLMWSAFEELCSLGMSACIANALRVPQTQSQTPCSADRGSVPEK